MSAIDTTAVYTYPRSAGPQDLYLAVKSLVDQMRRVRVSDADDAAQIQTLGEQIGAAVAADIEAGQLTPDEAYDAMISATAASIIGEATTSANAAYAAAAAKSLAQLRQVVQTYTQQASIKVEQVVRLSETESFAQQTETLAAYLAGTGATMTDISTAVATGDDSVAEKITTVQTQSNGNTTAISQIISSDGGTTTNWAVTTNANGQVTGMVALSGAASGTTFAVVADKFIVAMPGAPGTTIAAFIVGLVNGVSTVGINGNLLVDGTILARHIAANTITANKLSVGTLSAIAANMGTVTAGLIQSTSGDSYWNLTTGEFQIGG